MSGGGRDLKMNLPPADPDLREPGQHLLFQIVEKKEKGPGVEALPLLMKKVYL